MKHWLNNYFGFTKQEYNAILALFGLIALAFVTPYLYEHFFTQAEVMDVFEKNAIQKLSLINEKEQYKYPNQPLVKSTLFKFDPNQISISEWQKLGLSSKQAQSIINYRNKGGKFREADDLKKMYTISPQIFKRLQPYVQLPEDPGKKQLKNDYPAKTYPKRELIIVEVNRADTTSLDEIKGIGAAFARRIVKYRDRLGGFYHKDQLMEVFGLDSIKFEEIKGQVSIDAAAIKKININTVDFEGLKNHPYLKYKEINAIIQYRKQHGKYTTIADLKKLLILTPQTITKIAPYLIF